MSQSTDALVLDPPPSGHVSPLATFLGWGVLRMGCYPGRSLVGTFVRKEGRRRGGRSFYCRADDGTRLAGWLSPAAPEAARKYPGRLPVILSHGWIETKECHFRQAWRLNERGHDVVLFDHRGHGRSKGQWVTFGVRERHDLMTIADEAIRRGFIGQRFITMGFSLGAATVLQHAAIDPRAAGVVAFAPFVDFREAIKSFRDKLAPWMHDDWLLPGFEKASRQAGFALHEASTIEAARRIDVPVLLVEGGCDQALPPCSHTRKLAPVMKHGRMEVVTVDQASHRSLCRGCWPELEQSVGTFCASVT